MSTFMKKTLGEIATFVSGGTPSKSRNDYWGGELPWVSAKDLKIPIITDSLDRLTTTGFAEANKAPKNSLLILVRGMTLFKDVPVCLAGSDVAFNQDIKALIVEKAVAPRYLLYYLASQKNRLLDLVDSAGHGTGRLDTESLKTFPVLYPSLPEQTAIADLLSTWDDAIEKAERLIAAKDNRFASLTQELIHNCAEGLRHFHLRDICEPVTRKNSVNKLNVLTSSAQHGLISQMVYYKKSVSAEDVRGYYLLKKGEFAYNRSSSNGYSYGAIKRLEDYPQGVLSTLSLCFSLKKGAPCDSDFMAHAFEAGLLKKQADALRRQKRGLMQKLLTGIWRVKIGVEVER